MDALTTTISPLVIDIILAAVILTFACLKAKAGLFHSVMSIVIIILSIGVGLVGSKLLLDPVVNYAWESYSEKVANQFDAGVEKTLNGEKTISKVFEENWNEVIDEFNIDALDSLYIQKQDVDYTDSELVAKLRSLTLMKARLVCEKVCHLALFGLCMAASLLLFTLLKNMLEKVANFSIVGWANHAGGFILGFVEILVILIVVGRVGMMLNISAIDNIRQGTVLCNWICGGDLESSITTIRSFTLEDVKNIKLEDLTTVDFNEVESELKDIVNSVDLSGAPEELTDVLEKIDTDALKEEAEGVKNAVTDAVEDSKNKDSDEEDEGLGKKLLNGAKDSVTDAVKEGVKDAVDEAVKEKVSQ